MQFILVLGALLKDFLPPLLTSEYWLPMFCEGGLLSVSSHFSFEWILSGFCEFCEFCQDYCQCLLIWALSEFFTWINSAHFLSWPFSYSLILPRIVSRIILLLSTPCRPNMSQFSSNLCICICNCVAFVYLLYLCPESSCCYQYTLPCANASFKLSLELVVH